MALKWKELERIVEELRPLFLGSIIQKIAQTASYAFGEGVVIHGYGPQGAWYFFISIFGEITSCHLLPAKKKLTFATNPSGFIVLLRKNILGTKITAVEQIAKERIVIISFENGKKLLIDVIPRRGNIALAEGNDKLRVWGSFRAMELDSNKNFIFPVPPPKMHEQERKWEDLPGETYNEKIANLFDKEFEKSDFLSLQRKARHAVKAQLKKIISAKDSAASDLRRAQEAEQFKDYGKALVAKLYELGAKVIPKQKQIVIVTELGHELKIPLDTNLNYSQNAEAFFQKAKKFNRAVGELEKQIRLLEEKQIILQNLLQKVDTAKDEEVIFSLDKEFKKQNIIMPGDIVEKDEQEAKPYIEATSTDGFTILCGRTQEENRQVTFHESKGSDIWMHIKGQAGAHVVIHAQKNKSVPLSTLLEGAQMALYYSKWKKGKKAEVDYTFRKNVKAIKGTLAEVTYTGNKSLYVELNPESIKHILQRKI